jgi:ribonuclease J
MAAAAAAGTHAHPKGQQAPTSKPTALAATDVRVVFLGGLGEIGRNCCCIEQNGRIVIIDVGLMFPEADMPGVDLVLPDFSYLRENSDRIDGVLLTHGHEDHVGGLSYLLREVDVPMLHLYGSALTLAFARGRIEESGLLGRVTFHPMADGETASVGEFQAEFIPVAHSTPHSCAVALHTAQGVIYHSGDFKLDLTPIDGRTTDLARVGELSKGPGIRLMLADSTNAESEGFTDSERTVGRSLLDLFRGAGDQRLVVACFASHIHRVQQIVDAAVACGRTVTTLGRSMKRNIQIAREMGLINVSDGVLFDIEELSKKDPSKVCIISTGSQGEPMSALALMAANENRWLKINEKDTVILSSHAIPGNETNVGRIIDGLTRLGADVVHSGLAKVHVSGHAKRGELKTLHSIARPQFFIPVHGEFRHMTHHARLAMEMGMAPNNILICEDGDSVVLNANGIDFGEEVPAGFVYVDGIVGDVGRGVLRDRRKLSEEGVLVVIATVDLQTFELVNGPEVVTRGWVYAPDAETLLGEATETVQKALLEALTNQVDDIEQLKQTMRRSTGKFVSERTKRKPMIVPVLLEV